MTVTEVGGAVRPAASDDALHHSLDWRVAVGDMHVHYQSDIMRVIALSKMADCSLEHTGLNETGLTGKGLCA